MKKVSILLILLLSWKTFFAQIDTTQQTRYISRSTMYGAGFTNILDTYLSPLEYTGVDFRISRENFKMTNLWDGNVSAQSFLQVNFSYTENKPATSTALSGLANWNYALHYQFPITDNLTILTGGLSDMNFGFIYNLRNSNNPASAKAYINLAASAMLIYRFKIKNYPMTIRYQANLPFMGVMFSPNYQQSYYEIFTLSNYRNVIKFTSLHNQPAVRHFLSLDVPIKYSRIRFSYLWDVQQAHVNSIKTHTYSHIFMVGYVKTIYKIKSKDSQPSVY